MKKYFILMAAITLLLSCSHGKTKNFPSVADPSNAAQVFIIRNDNLFGWGMSLKVALDGTVVARLRAGEHVSFSIEPGFHSISVRESSVDVTLRENRKHYFLISADSTQFGFEISRISDERGNSWVARTKAIN
jgi:hypothetical protein